MVFNLTLQTVLCSSTFIILAMILKPVIIPKSAVSHRGPASSKTRWMSGSQREWSHFLTYLRLTYILKPRLCLKRNLEGIFCSCFSLVIEFLQNQTSSSKLRLVWRMIWIQNMNLLSNKRKNPIKGCPYFLFCASGAKENCIDLSQHYCTKGHVELGSQLATIQTQWSTWHILLTLFFSNIEAQCFANSISQSEAVNF